MNNGYFKVSVRSHDALGDDEMHRGPGGSVPDRPLTFVDDDGKQKPMRDPDPKPKKIYQWLFFFDAQSEQSLTQARGAALAKFEQVMRRAQGADREHVRLWSTHHELVASGARQAA